MSSRLALVGTLLLVCAVLASCGSARQTLPTRALPSVAVGVEQTRPDFMSRRIQIRLVNGDTDTLTVTRAAFTSRRLSTAAVWSGSSTIAPGAARNLAVDMPVATCAQAPIGAVTIYYVDGDGAARTTVVPEDRFETVSRFMQRDCSRATVQKVATVSVPVAVRMRGTGRQARAFLDLEIAPSGRAGFVTLDTIDDTILFTSPDQRSWPVHRTIDGTGPPQRLSIELVPNRCDPHVLAEDKVGTLFALHAHRVRGADLSYFLDLDEQQRSDLFDFVTEYCGLGASS